MLQVQRNDCGRRRNSVPDWEPFLQPKAPFPGAPNVLMIVWDDVGYGAMDASRRTD